MQLSHGETQRRRKTQWDERNISGYVSHHALRGNIKKTARYDPRLITSRRGQKAGLDLAQGKAVPGSCGVMSCRLFRISGDPNRVVILEDCNAVEENREFLQSRELKEASGKSGVCQLFDIGGTTRFRVRVEKGSS